MNIAPSLANFVPGLRVQKHNAAPILSAPAKWACPVWLDNRPYMLPADDQGQTQTCAGQAMAGLIEAWRWRATHTPNPVNGFAIYSEAKRLDNESSPGTTFDSAFAAAKSLALIPPYTTFLRIPSVSDLRFALHRHGVILAGFNITDGWEFPDHGGWIEPSTKDLGGHAVALCWFDPAGIGFQNSWGANWGVRGFGRITWEQASAQFVDAIALDFTGKDSPQ
jgi:hypothetical protein